VDIVSADSDVARIIAACNEQMWRAYLEKNVLGHNAILSDDYTSIHPDGSLHNGRPRAAAIASEPIAAFRFSQFRSHCSPRMPLSQPTSLTLIPRQARSLRMLASLPERCG
jgi:hypothetical protein